MNRILLYIVESTVVLSILYLISRMVLSREPIHKANRIILLSIPLIAILLPSLKFEVNITVPTSINQLLRLQPVNINTIENPGAITYNEIEKEKPIISNEVSKEKNPEKVIHKDRLAFYLLILLSTISSIFLLRFFILYLKIMFLIRKGEKRQEEELIIVHTNRNISPFSYFHYLFINTNGISEADFRNIIVHEQIHVRQLHTLDNLYMEFIGIFQWFNPFYWLLRASLIETHEFLADEGALNQGINRTDYQVLLLNQVAEGPVLALTCNFSESLTKKRIIMMQRNKKSGKWPIQKLAIFLPAITMLVIIFSCNAQTKENAGQFAAVSPTKMNVLYLGVDNPIAIAVSDASLDEIEVELDNGEIIGKNGEYIIRPQKPGMAIIKVFQVNKGKRTQVKEAYFRVKTVPDPVTFVAGKKGGTITKSELLKADEIRILMENFDFDLSFKVLSFVVSTTAPGTYTVHEEISNSNKFSKSQKELIKGLVKNQKIYFEDIKVTGPDGSIRKLGTVGFEIKENS